MNHNNLRGIFWFIPILISFLFAQETHNLEIIWERGTPGDTLFFTYGSELSSGDFNGDGYSDIVVNGDSWIDPIQGICIYKAYIFFGGPQFDTIPDVVIASDSTWGFTVIKGIGDINGDGFDDLALGGSFDPNGTCMLYIFLGGNPLDTICDFRMRGGGAFGYALGSGDVNGDNYNDLIIGAKYAAPMPGGYDMGKVHINFGGPNFDSIIDLTLNGGHEGDREQFGALVNGSGDVNDDGFNDIIICAHDFGQTEGRVYIYFGGNPMDTLYDVAMRGEGPWQMVGGFGVDFLKNQNDFDDAIFSSSFWPYGFPLMCKGKVYVLKGGDQMDSVPDVWMIGATDSSLLGMSISSAGFIDRSTSEAIIAGAVGEGGFWHGAAYSWLGGIQLDTSPDAWMKGTIPDQSVGYKVATAGDVDGDNKDEIMISNYATDETPQQVWVCKYTGPGIEERSTQKAERLILEIKPNPAKSVIRVRSSLPVKEIKVYDITGKIVKVFNIAKRLESGKYEIKWDLSNNNQNKISSGIYFIKAAIDNGQDIISEINKIIVTR